MLKNVNPLAVSKIIATFAVEIKKQRFNQLKVIKLWIKQR